MFASICIEPLITFSQPWSERLTRVLFPGHTGLSATGRFTVIHFSRQPGTSNNFCWRALAMNVKRTAFVGTLEAGWR